MKCPRWVEMLDSLEIYFVLTTELPNIFMLCQSSGWIDGKFIKWSNKCHCQRKTFATPFYTNQPSQPTTLTQQIGFSYFHKRVVLGCYFLWTGFRPVWSKCYQRVCCRSVLRWVELVTKCHKSVELVPNYYQSVTNVLSLYQNVTKVSVAEVSCDGLNM